MFFRVILRTSVIARWVLGCMLGLLAFACDCWLLCCCFFKFVAFECNCWKVCLLFWCDSAFYSFFFWDCAEGCVGAQEFAPGTLPDAATAASRAIERSFSMAGMFWGLYHRRWAWPAFDIDHRSWPTCCWFWSHRTFQFCCCGRHMTLL